MGWLEDFIFSYKNNIVLIALLVRKFFFLENRVHIFAPPCNIRQNRAGKQKQHNGLGKYIKTTSNCINKFTCMFDHTLKFVARDLRSFTNGLASKLKLRMEPNFETA